MKTAKKAPNTAATADRGMRIRRTISIYPKHERKLIAAAGQDDVSPIIRELIDNGIDEDGTRKYLDARDRELEFEVDVVGVLKAAGIDVQQHVRVTDESPPTGILATWKDKKCCVELKSSGRPERLALALASALVLRGQSHLPAVVCVPYFVHPGMAEAFRISGVGLAKPENVAATVKEAVGLHNYDST